MKAKFVVYIDCKEYIGIESDLEPELGSTREEVVGNLKGILEKVSSFQMELENGDFLIIPRIEKVKEAHFVIRFTG